MLLPCPFCHISLPLPDLEWHVNNHLVEDEFEKDTQLAQQIAIAPPSPRLTDEPLNFAESSDNFPNRESCTSSFNYMSPDYSEIIDQEKVSCLVNLQIKSNFYKIEGGLMALLRRCLELEKQNSRSVISGYIDHYQSIKSEDSGWGCGWRNIQMLSSHLLMERHDARDVMFGGSGFVPDIPSLQRWLEIAWKSGYDRVGSDTFNYNVYGSTKWIGTTECATLFRSFGLRARIVDFDDKSYAMGDLAVRLNTGRCRGKNKVTHACGPIDKFLYRDRHDNIQMGSCENSDLGDHNMASLPSNCSALIDNESFNKFEGKANGHQVLVDWVWNYFASDVCGGLDDFRRVRISEKTPLYFQHDGHSRTIVGIQMQKGLHRSQDRYTLLVLDPSQRTADLERSLRDCNGWQKLIKRGVHTLKKQQYQLCYVDPGIAPGEEIEQLKTIDSILVKS